ncbi:thioredoxin-disulfide reductase [Segatella buccae]|uniref:thioredoxin-disulfide reductase n=1 Tax=Segatella buccae TaxID=28126 RepID=UPI0022E2A070|nr:thioredoxin-disulfide reductase [Segatella buccae]
MANREYTRCLIIGSGPAGYTAAIYAGRANLQPIEYCGMQMGGQLTQTTTVENFPGYPQGVDGNQMMMELREQAERFGATLRDGEIVKADLSKAPYLLTTDRGDEIEAETVIIATGATAKYLGLDDEKKYNGQGVSACATCDGFFYRKKMVAVVGGGDTACEEAIYLAQLASKVYMIVRKPYLRASDVMKKRVEENEKIEILYETNTLGLYGENGVEGAHLVYRKGEADERKYDLPIDGFFLAIGHKPQSDLFRDFVDVDEQGYIKVDSPTQATKVPGVFAAGDVCDPRYRQAIVAAGTGAKAALDAEKYLNGLGK